MVDDLNATLMPLRLHVRPFGSFLSNMGFPDSDVDLLLAGDWQGRPVYSLTDSGRRTVLRKVGIWLTNRGAARGAVQYVLHARVPLIKFVHAGSGVECDLTLQSYDGALKGRFMGAVAQLDTR
jgi:DNA polymerase sigma